jgi:cell division protein FtsW
MFVFGMLANAARHEPEAIAALCHHGQGTLAKLLRLPPPEPYRPVARPPSARGVR